MNRKRVFFSLSIIFILSCLTIIYQYYSKQTLANEQFFFPYSPNETSTYTLEVRENNVFQRHKILRSCFSEDKMILAKRYFIVEMKNSYNDFTYSLFADSAQNIYMVNEKNISIILSKNNIFYPASLFSPIEVLKDVVNPICEVDYNQKERDTVTVECSALYQDILSKNTQTPKVVRVKYIFTKSIGLTYYKMKSPEKEVLLTLRRSKNEYIIADISYN